MVINVRSRAARWRIAPIHANSGCPKARLHPVR